MWKRQRQSWTVTRVQVTQAGSTTGPVMGVGPAGSRQRERTKEEVAGGPCQGVPGTLGRPWGKQRAVWSPAHDGLGQQSSKVISLCYTGTMHTHIHVHTIAHSCIQHTHSRVCMHRACTDHTLCGTCATGSFWVQLPLFVCLSLHCPSPTPISHPLGSWSCGQKEAKEEKEELRLCCANPLPTPCSLCLL